MFLTTTSSLTAETRHDAYEALLLRCQALEPVPTAVAYPCEATALAGAIEAATARLIEPILVGPEARIRAVAKAAGLDLDAYAIVDVPDARAAAAKAVELVRTARAELIMKGSLHTDELLSAVVAAATGWRTGRRSSHAFVMSIPTYPKPLIVTDAAINIAPGLEDKRDIGQGLGWLGIGIEPEANARGRGRLSPPERAPSVWVIPTDEESVIAAGTLAVGSAATASGRRAG